MKAGIKMTEFDLPEAVEEVEVPEAKIVEHNLVNNSGKVVGTEKKQYVDSNPGHSGRSFNTIEVPVLHVDATEEEDVKATEAAKKIAGK